MLCPGPWIDGSERRQVLAGLLGVPSRVASSGPPHDDESGSDEPALELLSLHRSLSQVIHHGPKTEADLAMVRGRPRVGQLGDEARREHLRKRARAGLRWSSCEGVVADAVSGSVQGADQGGGRRASDLP